MDGRTRPPSQSSLEPLPHHRNFEDRCLGEKYPFPRLQVKHFVDFPPRRIVGWGKGREDPKGFRPGEFETKGDSRCFHSYDFSFYFVLFWTHGTEYGH